MALFPLTFPFRFGYNSNSTYNQHNSTYNQHSVSARLLIEDSDGDIYTTTVTSFQIDHSSLVPTAIIDIEINVAGATDAYISPIRFDNIVRLQVDERINARESSVFVDKFEGRVTSIQSELSNSNRTRLTCRGHEEELLWSPVTAAYSASSTTTGSIMSSLCGSYLSRLTGNTLIDTSGSTTISSFNVKKDSKFMVDVVSDLLQLEGYAYRFRASTTYNSDGTLASVTPVWEPVPTSVSETLRVLEGTDRLISARFRAGIEGLVKTSIVYGESGEPQKRGSYSNTWTSHDYGNRYSIETDRSIASDSLCADLAEQIAKNGGEDSLKPSGTLVLLGMPEVQKGDLITVNIPSVIINGEQIKDSFRVQRVGRVYSDGQIATTLDVGSIELREGDIIARGLVASKRNNLNLID